MKIFTRTLILLLIISISYSCKKAKVKVNFDLSIADIVFVIDTTSVTGMQTLSESVIVPNLETELKNQSSKASLDDIKSIILKSAELEIMDPTSQTFDIISSAEGSFGGGSLATIKVVWKDVIPATGLQHLDLDVSSTDIAPYVKLPQITYQLKGNLVAPLTQQTKLKGKITFRVEAEVSPI